MNIEQNYNYRSTFKALNLKKKGFEQCPELADSIIKDFLANKNVDAFIKEHDVDVTIKKKKNAYKFIMEILNPNRKGFLAKLFKPKKLKIKYTETNIRRSGFGKQYNDGIYFDEGTRSHYVEYGSPYGYGKDGIRPKTWIYVRNINEDIENLLNGTKISKRKMAKQNKESRRLINNYAGDDTPYWEKFGCSKHEYTQFAGGN